MELNPWRGERAPGPLDARPLQCPPTWRPESALDVFEGSAKAGAVEEGVPVNTQPRAPEGEPPAGLGGRSLHAGRRQLAAELFVASVRPATRDSDTADAIAARVQAFRELKNIVDEKVLCEIEGGGSNPVYDLLPRMRWVTDSGICQRPSDFQFDTKSQSHCCPSPNYCCPNSVTNCGAAGARLFDVRDTVSDDAIATLFPLGQNAPYEWEMTERSFVHVATVWRRVARRSWREQRYEESALKMLHGAFSRGRISKDGWRSFALNATKPFRDGGKLLAPYGRVAAFARDVYCSTKDEERCDFGPIQPPISA